MKLITKKLSNGVQLNLIKTTKFKSLVINIAFKGTYKPKDITGMYLLSKILVDSTKKYHASELLSKQLNYLYGANLSVSSQIVGTTSLFSISASILDPKLVPSSFNLLEKIFSLINQIIYHPKISNGLFDNETFEKIKLSHMYRLKSIENDKEAVANIRVKELIDDNHPFRLVSLGNLKELEKTTNQDLINLYHMIIEQELEVYVLGDFDIPTVSKLVTKYLKGSKKLNTGKPIIKLKQIKSKKVIEQKQFNQSQLQYLLTTNTVVNEKDYYPLIMFNAIFGRTPLSKLFRIVREKHSLCYSISSTYHSNYGVITISAGIDSKNYALADKLIKQQLTEMKQGKFSLEDLELNRKMLITIAEHTFDQPSGLLNYVASSRLVKTEFTKEAYIAKLNKVTKKEIIKVAKKVELKIAYFLKQGEQNATK